MKMPQRPLLKVCMEPHWYTWTQCSTIPWNEALCAEGVRPVRHQRHRLVYYIAATLGKAGLVRNLGGSRRNAFLVGLNWASENRLFPVCYQNEIVPWITDCWGVDFPKWRKVFSRHRFRHVFFSARDAIGVFKTNFPDTTFHWLPEAVVGSRFDPRLSLAERKWKVFELGRNYPPYHAVIRKASRAMGCHLFDKFVDPERELPGVLATTALLVCFPRSITNPQQAGPIETVTPRYFEGMASGCLLIGHAPAELVDLFGYNPAVEVDWARPAEQLNEILGNLAAYQPLVQRNLERTHQAGTFTHRARQMLHVLGEHGYRWS